MNTTKRILAVASFLFSVAVQAQMLHFLVAEWNSGGNHFCRYDNGTVLNVGVQMCPMSIR